MTFLKYSKEKDSKSFFILEPEFVISLSLNHSVTDKQIVTKVLLSGQSPTSKTSHTIKEDRMENFKLPAVFFLG